MGIAIANRKNRCDFGALSCEQCWETAFFGRGTALLPAVPPAMLFFFPALSLFLLGGGGLGFLSPAAGGLDSKLRFYARV